MIYILRFSDFLLCNYLIMIFDLIINYELYNFYYKNQIVYKFAEMMLKSMMTFLNKIY